MFCPNCGKDCGEFQFCPYCGTKVVKAEPVQGNRQGVWSVGKPCPYCGGNQVENGKCVFCDAILATELPKEEGTLNIPCGLYEGVSSSLQLYEKKCIVKCIVPLRTIT